MNKFLKSWMLLSGLLVAMGLITGPVLAQTYVSKWSAEGDANDSNGINNGSLSGNVWIDAAGQVGSAFHFGGGKVVINDDPSLDIENFTSISFWFKTDQKPDIGAILVTKGSWQLHLLGPNNECGGGAAGREQCDGAIVLSILNGGKGAWRTAVHATDKKYHDGEWHHVVGMLNHNKKASIWVDGEFKGEAVDAIEKVKVNDNPVTIGSAITSRARRTDFMGLIDEVAIYGRPLEANEIEDVAAGGALPGDLDPNNAPVADAGDDVSNEAIGPAGASVTLDGSSSSDPDDDALTYLWSADGIVFDDATSATPTGTFPVGTTTVTLTVDDGNGETATDEVLVTITDETPPDVTYSLSTTTLWPPNHKMIHVASGISASDIVDGDVSVAITVVSSDGDGDGTGDGNTELDWEISGGDVYLRAERDGGQDGRVYTITLKATDAAGNTTTVVGTVAVPHDQQVASAGNGKGKGKAKKIVSQNGVHTMVVGESITIVGEGPVVANQLVDVAGQADVAPRVQIPVVENHTFSLSQNHPNPFNPETVIGYALGEASDVRLIIYNVLGQQVRELVNVSQAPGQYSVRWDGRNALGAQVTSGVYIYRLVAGTQVEMRKMILLK